MTFDLPVEHCRPIEWYDRMLGYFYQLSAGEKSISRKIDRLILPFLNMDWKRMFLEDTLPLKISNLCSFAYLSLIVRQMKCRFLSSDYLYKHSSFFFLLCWLIVSGDFDVYIHTHTPIDRFDKNGKALHFSILLLFLVLEHRILSMIDRWHNLILLHTSVLTRRLSIVWSNSA